MNIGETHIHQYDYDDIIINDNNTVINDKEEEEIRKLEYKSQTLPSEVSGASDLLRERVLAEVREQNALESDDFYKDSKARLEKVEGGIIGKDIFLLENIQNLKTENNLRKLGYTVETVYDGFYTNAPEEVWWREYQKVLRDSQSIWKSLIKEVKEK